MPLIPQCLSHLFGTAEKLASDRSVRAVVLHGAGPDFCAGVDISTFAGAGIGASIGERMKPRTESGANFFQSAATCWRDLPVPVIAALQGSAFGAGFQIAMGADIRYAAADTRMSIMEIKWGIIPDMGITATLPGILPEDKARELAFTGRIVAADEARALNLVTGVCDDPLAKALAIAGEIARNPRCRQIDQETDQRLLARKCCRNAGAGGKTSDGGHGRG